MPDKTRSIEAALAKGLLNKPIQDLTGAAQTSSEIPTQRLRCDSRRNGNVQPVLIKNKNSVVGRGTTIALCPKDHTADVNVELVDHTFVNTRRVFYRLPQRVPFMEKLSTS